MIFKNNKIKPIIQEEIADCGLACLTMILNSFGKEYSIHYLKNIYASTTEGFNLYDIANIAKKEKLIPLPFNIDQEEFQDLKLPCIAHLEENHFVVIENINKKNVTYLDPQEGEITLKHTDFFKRFSFVVCEFEKEDSFKKDEGDSKEIKKINSIFNYVKNIKGFWGNIFHIFLISLSLEFFILIIPFFYKNIIDNIIIEKQTDYLIPLGVGFLFIILFKSLSEWFRNNMILFLSRNIQTYLKYNIINKMLKLPSSYFKKRDNNDIFSKLTSLDEIREKLSSGIIFLIMDSITIMFTALFMLYINPILFLIVFSFLILILIIKSITFRKLKKYTKNNIDAKLEENNFINENIKKIETTKSHGQEDYVFKKWYSLYINTVNKKDLLDKNETNINNVSDLLINFQRLIVIWLGAAFVLSEELSIGVLIAFFAYQIIFSQQALNLFSNFFEFKILSIHFDKISDIILQKEEENLTSKNYNNFDIQGKIELKNIYFKYDNKENYLFENLSLTINKGESVVITGDSGSGKTTLLKIITGLIPIEKGNILFDDVNIKDIGLDNLRKNISVILQQEQQLYSGTIVDNITHFSNSFNVENVIEAAEKSCIKADIENLTMNYDTFISEDNNIFSKGQIQRILIARALYREPKILFIDEGMSALNNEFEIEVVNNLKSENMTRVSITHREESKLLADRIININELKVNKNV
jgi:ATP-binding cassette subfamily B protein RaxB